MAAIGAAASSCSMAAVGRLSSSTIDLCPAPSRRLLHRPPTCCSPSLKFPAQNLRTPSRIYSLSTPTVLTSGGSCATTGKAPSAAATTSSSVADLQNRVSCSSTRGRPGWLACERLTSTTTSIPSARAGGKKSAAALSTAVRGMTEGSGLHRSSRGRRGQRSAAAVAAAAAADRRVLLVRRGSVLWGEEVVGEGGGEEEGLRRRRASGLSRAVGDGLRPSRPLLPAISCSASDGHDTSASGDAHLSSSSLSEAAAGRGRGASTAPPKNGGDGDGGNAVYPAVAVACLGAFLFGYHLGVVNGSLEYIAKDLGILKDTAAQGWIVSSSLAGAAIGALSGGSLADWLGRTRAFQVDVLPLVVGTLMSANSNVVQSMILGRFIVGIGIGLTSAVVPLYISEVAPTDIRGKLGTVNQLCICIGILGALVAGLPLAGNPVWWRTMFSLAAVPAVLLGIGMQFCPESPRWLYQQGKMKQTEEAVGRLWGRSRADLAMAELRESGGGGTSSSSSSSSGSGEEESRWLELFGKRYWRVMLIGIAMFFFQQFAGINAVVYYSSAVFRKVGIVSDVAASALVGATNVVGTAIASFLMDKQGRKKLLIGSFAGMALSMLVLAVSLSWKGLARFSGILAVVGTMAYVLAFSLGVGPVPALLLPEIFPNRIRAKAVALSLVTHWVCNFVVGLTFLGIVNSIGVSSVYLGFAGVCLLAILFVDRFVVETKGRSLEEIERMLAVSAP
ncbi:hypothetical protein CBR_g39323 [Chara braunii]|uniref:Major facilitator superfamily (MFS) profile domain-containing protein n=1 Tax=Chara braunii TaxID=69332 RepID=A0A388K164_CHABU|nr:hypothetical protein CBR_g39323 [Chara braunii]|eukprot:GBG63779.1 hypothetical protein CBR_g39323 [Chara braunii]